MSLRKIGLLALNTFAALGKSNGAVHSTKKFQFKIGEVFSSEKSKNSIFWTFQKRGQPHEVYSKCSQISYWKFPFLSIFFPHFSVEWFTIGNSIVFRFSGNFQSNCPYHLTSFRKFWNLGLNGKPPSNLILY